MREIILNTGNKALVDDDIFEKYGSLKWYENKGHVIHQNYLGGGRLTAKYKTVQLHRFIMEAPADKEVDHINRNGLDNRRCNLRLTDRSGNCLNRGNWGKFAKGVTLHNGRYIARIWNNKKEIRLGSFATEKEASIAYITARASL